MVDVVTRYAVTRHNLPREAGACPEYRDVTVSRSTDSTGYTDSPNFTQLLSGTQCVRCETLCN